jgi:hypothetical protein
MILLAERSLMSLARSLLRIRRRLRLVLVRFATRESGRCANLVWSAIRRSLARPEYARTVEIAASVTPLVSYLRAGNMSPNNGRTE